jgi:hypothetical protein
VRGATLRERGQRHAKRPRATKPTSAQDRERGCGEKPQLFSPIPASLHSLSTMIDALSRATISPAISALTAIA